MEMRNCPYCGKPVGPTLERCPFCREAIPKIKLSSPAYATLGRTKIRQGFLYALMAAVIHYFAGGYSGMNLPVPVPPFVTMYLTPLLFLAGLGLVLYGVFLRMRS